MDKQKIILYATGSPLIVDFEEVCIKNNYDIVAIINNREDIESYATLTEKEVLLSQLSKLDSSIPFVCTLFSPNNRFTAVNEALSQGLKPLKLLNDRNNDLPIAFSHGRGCFINKGVTIGSQSQIGDFVTINRGAALGHHLSIDSYSSVGPGVTTGGNVTIGKGVFIGTGAVILPKITIGKNAIIGAGAVVTKNVSENSLVVGNPAKVVKQNPSVNF